MINAHDTPFLAFVWRPEEISPAVTAMSRRTSTRAVFDCSGVRPDRCAAALLEARAADVKLSCDFFLSEDLEPFLEVSGVRNLWIEVHPAVTPDGGDAFIERFRRLASKPDLRCIPVSGDGSFLAGAVRMQDPPAVVALKGSEASGFTGTESTGTLYALLRGPACSRGDGPGLVVWGGISTPEAAAAFLCTGARGIVFESMHWGTSLIRATAEGRARISRIRPEHSTVVGRDTGLRCRLFDRGNSSAVREIRRLPRESRPFLEAVLEKAVHPLECDLSRDDLALLGPEAAFADGFRRRFGEETEGAIRGFSEEVAAVRDRAVEISKRSRGGPAARALGTTYPLIQGAMSWISDVPEFARSVAEAGGLPTLALGMKDARLLDLEPGHPGAFLGDRPYAVNVVALPENPHLDEQLAWIERTRPPFVVIAAGEPSRAEALRRTGAEVIYIASSEGLLRMALEAGIRWLVLEGNEAGGHVGEHTTLTLAQMALEMKRREPDLFEGRRIVLAGGICDRETAFRGFMLGADAVQMGTAYLATEEIVASGALSPLYQRLVLESAPGGTAVSGEGAGLRVRSLRTPKLREIRSLEDTFDRGACDETTFRSRLEVLSAGSLLVAARAVERPGGSLLDEATCLERGQFMSGAVAGLISERKTVADLHREVAEGDLDLTLPERMRAGGTAAARSRKARDGAGRVAITGMAMANALGRSPEAIWEAALAMRSGVSGIPPSRWDHSLYYDPDPRAPGKTYCSAGAFQDLRISRKDVGVAPQDFRTMTDATRLTLWLAERAISGSGLLESDVPRERIGVVICQNSGEAAVTMSDLVLTMQAREIGGMLREAAALSPEQEEAAVEAIRSGRLCVDDTTLLGRLNSAAAGFLCNRYGFQGPSHAVTAACAGSLVALYTAVQMIRSGIVDAAVVGGGEECLHPSHYLEFSALKALAGLSGADRPAEESSRPFDADRDGMVLGEGGAMVVVERADLAERRHAPIHAWISGVGASNSHLGMVESLAETQEIALRSAFADAGYGPDTVDLVACHATSTVQGDVEEIKALKRFFTPGRRTVLSSFKSQIGHTLGASGLMSLIHSVSAMQAGVFPGTLNYRRKDPRIDLEGWGFHVPAQPLEWKPGGDGPRRVMVNAFGFGGANYVVHLEGHANGAGPVGRGLPAGDDFHAASGATLEPFTPGLSGVQCVAWSRGGRSCRVGVLADGEAEARAKLDALERHLSDCRPAPSSERALAREGVFAAPADTPAPPLAFVFTGQGSQYRGAGRTLYRTFPSVRAWMDRIAGLAGFDLLGLLFDSGEEDLRNTRWQQPALYTLEYAMVRSLMDLGVVPSAMGGHSLGELVALSVAGVFSWEDGFRIVDKRARCMEKAAALTPDPGIMVAVDAPPDLLRERTAGSPGVFFTNFNSPRQTVLGGDTRKLRDLVETLKAEGYRATQLDVSMAFHSPIMKVIREEMAAFVAEIPFHPPRIPVVSNTTRRPFPDDPEECRRILMAHLESPVHWMQNVEMLWSELGVRVFVEIGPRDTLCGLIQDTVEDAMAFPACLPEDEARTYRSAAARLYGLGHWDPPAGSLRHELRPAPELRPPPWTDRAARVVRREIDAFLLDSFGPELKPRLLAALRREVRPDLSEESLDRFLGAGGTAPVLTEAPRGGDPARPGGEAPFHEERQAPPTPNPPEADTLEAMIRIIMEATGYERNEIEPDMDLRQDLSIRSSRLPVIMAAAEERFGIVVRFEDFLGLRTVREVADRIDRLARNAGENAPRPALPSISKAVLPIQPSLTDETSSSEGEKPPLKRWTLEEIELSPPRRSPLSGRGRTVAVLAPERGFEPAASLSNLMEREHGLNPLVLPYLDRKAPQGDLCSADGAGRLAGTLEGIPSLGGLVLVMKEPPPDLTREMRGASPLLTGFFLCLKAFLASRDKAFALAFQPMGDQGGGGPAWEGVQGMLLAAALEVPDVIFRSMALGGEVDLKSVLETALDTELPVVPVVVRKDRFFSSRLEERPLAVESGPVFDPGPNPVIVLSGGARGITSRLARSLVPLSPRIILLGRTVLDPANETGGPSAEAAGTVAELSGHGVEVSYLPCDVSDAAGVERALAEVFSRYGRVDGIVHGAGVVRDALIPFVTPEDVGAVLEVKLLGAWNLYRAASHRGLRFFVALSSMASLQGNVGQAGYCAANRAMTALVEAMARQQDGLFTRSLILPPLEGAGMAEDPEVKELMRLRGLESAFVHVDELAAVFPGELLSLSPAGSGVVPARMVPEVRTTPAPYENPREGGAGTSGWAPSFEPERWPMLDGIERLDAVRGRVSALRTFSADRDLWLEDHRPFKFLEHPPVSAIMAVEAFLEAALLLTPYLPVTGLRRIELKEMLACPPEREREARIEGRRLGLDAGRMITRVVLSAAGVSPAGKALGTWIPCFEGEVLQRAPVSLENGADLAVSAADLDSRPMDPEEVRDWYERRSDLGPRYRVIERMEGSGPGGVAGLMVYPENRDFAGERHAPLRYAAYLLEALMHLASFYVIMRDEEETRPVIPAGLDEVAFGRPCVPGERIRLEGRLRAGEPGGFLWDARGTAAGGEPLMTVSGLKMSWFEA